MPLTVDELRSDFELCKYFAQRPRFSAEEIGALFAEIDRLRAPSAHAAPSVPEGCPPHAEVYVGDGRFAICDWQDWHLVRAYNWRLTTRARSGCLYAQAWDSDGADERSRISMHRLILPTPPDKIVDHINGDGLDNRRANLRIATHQQNSFNVRSHGGASRFRGVSFEAASNLWRAYITLNGKRKYLGRHGLEIDAAKAYNMAAKEAYGDFARLNAVD